MELKFLFLQFGASHKICRSCGPNHVWHTDILTPAQKYKRKLFCTELLRLPHAALMQRISGWLFTDEKWWDIVGPSMSQYVKAGSKSEAKMQNQAGFAHVIFLLFFFIDFPVCVVVVFVFAAKKTQEQKRRHKETRILLGGDLLAS